MNFIIMASIYFFFIVVIGIVILIVRQWKIPVCILKYQGDKRRPAVLITKARKKTNAGITRLYVRGYKIPIRDFKSEYYYPFVKGKLGALILFEPKQGILTPVLPFKKKKDVPRELREAHKAFVSLLEDHKLNPVDFGFDEQVFNSILLKMVDDTDVDFLLQEYARTDSQYTTGWQEFLSKYGAHLALTLIAILMFAGFIVWLQQSPDLAAQCYSQVQEVSKNALAEYSAGLAGGSPPV